MAENLFSEGVKPGGITQSGQLRILLCYIINNVNTPVDRQQIEEVLLNEELANYFVLAEGFAQIEEQELVVKEEGGYIISEKGRLVAQTLEKDLPKTVRETAIRAMLRAQHYAMLKSQNISEIANTEEGIVVKCSIGDEKGRLFEMNMYVPDTASAETVKNNFIENGAEVYKLMLQKLLEKKD